MSDIEKDQLHEQLMGLIGTHVSKPTQAPDEVNMAMIRQWTDAFEDRNPIYEDKAFASQTRHGDMIAPPAMMQTWTMARPKLHRLSERGGMTVDIDMDSPLIVLDKAGYIGSLATNSEYEFVKDVHLGDVLTAEAVLESVSAKKKTGLGFGYFVTWLTSYTNQDDELVGRQRFSLLKFDPSTMGAVGA